MKNTSKKSKFVILPALATLVLTSVATVTGTAAWFTASRTATVTASHFESTSQSASMTVSTTPLVGTKDGTADSTTANSTASITVDGKITHGSYDAQAGNSGHLYVANVDDNEQVTSYVDYGTLDTAKNNSAQNTKDEHSKWAAEVGDNKSWYAVAWEMTFQMKDSSSLNKNALFIDYKLTEFEDLNNGDTIQGLRIAFMTTNYVRVVGGLETGEKHVKKAWTKSDSDTEESLKTLTGGFGTGIYHKHNSDIAKAIDANTTTLSQHDGYLGEFGTNNELTVTAVAWFEGEDLSIVKDKAMSKVKASLSFYSRQVLAA